MIDTTECDCDAIAAEIRGHEAAIETKASHLVAMGRAALRVRETLDADQFACWLDRFGEDRGETIVRCMLAVEHGHTRTGEILAAVYGESLCV